MPDSQWMPELSLDAPTKATLLRLTLGAGPEQASARAHPAIWNTVSGIPPRPSAGNQRRGKICSLRFRRPGADLQLEARSATPCQTRGEMADPCRQTQIFAPR